MKYTSTLCALTLVALLTGCSSETKSPAVADNIRKSLDQAGYKDVSVSQDRDKGVVTLTGHVTTEADKGQAEQLAKNQAVGQVVSDQIAVLPAGAESAAKTVNADVDKAIEKLFDAALIQNNLHDMVKYSAKNGVLTLTGDVNSQATRTDAQRIAASIPNVQQVVNEMQVKDQKATGSK
jgi:osmotically-inducible protein OsmY